MIDFDIFHSIKGFMDDDEALLLYREALLASSMGYPLLEIGSYCGKSAYVIGTACKQKDSILFSIDHHRGSEEQQKGQEYFDPELYDEKNNKIDTLPCFRKTIQANELQKVVIPLVTSSLVASKMWGTPLSAVFIDGGHSLESVQTDFLSWERHLVPKGILMFHDIFFDPSQGGQAPRMVYEEALKTGNYLKKIITKTLGVLEKKS